VGWYILQRYVLLELLRVFSLALFAITGILAMAGVVQEAAQQGLGPEQIIQVIPLIMIGTLPYTMPATCLFAVSVVYGRMSADNEITAVKAAGVPLTLVVWPSLWVGCCSSLIIYTLYQEFIPRAHHQLRSMVVNKIEDFLYARLQRDGRIIEPKLGYEIYVRKVEGRRLLYPLFKKRDAQGQSDVVVLAAREATLHVDLQENVLSIHMLHGEFVRGHQNTRTSVTFAEEVVPVTLPPIGSNRRIRARELTGGQLLGRLRDLEEEHETTLREYQQLQMSGVTDVAVLKNMEGRLQTIAMELNDHATESSMRPALSASCVFFVLIGCPVGIWFHRRDFLSSFVTCFLPIVFSYYPLMMFGINMGKKGSFNPMYGMWIGNGMLGVVGAILLLRLLGR
jgi:lipopolysaccharide export system permease protein